MLQNAQEMAPAAWWDLYGKHLPILTGVAKSVLAQVVCASAAERSNLSIYGQIKHKGRSQLSHAKSDKLVYINEALHLRNKLQKAGYKQGQSGEVGLRLRVSTTRATRRT